MFNAKYSVHHEQKLLEVDVLFDTSFIVQFQRGTPKERFWLWKVRKIIDGAGLLTGLPGYGQEVFAQSLSNYKEQLTDQGQE